MEFRYHGKLTASHKTVNRSHILQKNNNGALIAVYKL